jgi:hypothetical protein
LGLWGTWADTRGSGDIEGLHHAYSQQLAASLPQHSSAIVVDFVMVWYSTITTDHQNSTTSRQAVVETTGFASGTLGPRTWTRTRFRILVKSGEIE